MNRVLRSVAWLAALAVLAPQGMRGQTPVQSAAVSSPSWDVGRTVITRGELEALLKRLEEASASPAYSSGLRARSRFEAALTRQRLQEGDFHVGDRILLFVEGEKQLTDSFSVAAGRVLGLPDIGQVPMQGVLRSELEGHLRDFLGRYIRNPIVRAKSLIRLSILGGVGKPGFYVVPAEAALPDVLMFAGGPGPQSKLDKLRIERPNGERIWEGQRLQLAIAEGQTLDRLSLRAGDRIVMPGGGQPGGKEAVIRSMMLLISLPTMIYGLTKIF